MTRTFAQLRCAAGRRARGLPRRLADRSFTTGLSHDAAGPVLLLSPHLDDAVLDCWSVLAGPDDIRVVNVFAGVPPAGRVTVWDRICGARDSAEHMRARIAEDRAALARAGRVPVSLPFLDEQYRPCGPPPRLGDLDAAVVAHGGGVKALLAPLGAEHADHAFVRRYAVATGAQAGIPVDLYADVPYVSRLGWPHWIAGEPPDPNRNVDVEWDAYARRVPVLGDPRRARVVHLDAQATAAKIQALQAYRSQIAALDAGPRRLITNPAVCRHEPFWRVELPEQADGWWRGGVAPNGAVKSRKRS
jgi:hypothetical protein